MVVFPTGQPNQRRSTSQDSQATTAQINCVTEKADQQIFQSLGPQGTSIQQTRTH